MTHAGGDTLTGLPGRVHFSRALARGLSDSGGEPGTVAVVLLDLDRFKADQQLDGPRRR